MSNNNTKAWATRRAKYGADGGNVGPDQLPWCPREYREQYQHYRSAKRLGAAHARAIIEEEMARAGVSV